MKNELVYVNIEDINYERFDPFGVVYILDFGDGLLKIGRSINPEADQRHN